MKLGRKISGGKYIKRRKKKAYEKPGHQIPVKLGEEKRKSVRTRGGNKKTFNLKSKFINIGKRKIEIKNVLETPSNRFLARQNILTKGTIIETELGKAKITNRPSQEGMINGVLVNE
ncbi:MAG: 30S ribosomal protein S8e [Nanoarchaeota archaeon]|nr:30S ribosomal protein S8e [Nanoarchaeota archaeon]MBU1028248.1 30S ribosomal protein S8e [Nanoarchaeota archaeon]